MAARIHEYLTIRADSQPDAVAVAMDAVSYTYAGLESRSNSLARLLLDSGCKKGDRVALFAEKSPTAILGLIAILKADCLYVPLDVTSPPSRNAKILDECTPRCILMSPKSESNLVATLEKVQNKEEYRIGLLGHELGGDTHVRADFTMRDSEAQSDDGLHFRSNSEDPAQILFTSGSTGVPKGVIVKHSSICRFVDWAVCHFQMRPGDRISGHSPLHFDLSTFDMFGSLSSGATLFPVSPRYNLLANKLAEFIRKNRLTHWFSVPSVLNYMARFDVVLPGDFAELRKLHWCGEVFPTPALIYWMKRLPHVRFTNLYGPTEATIASSYYEVPSCPADPRTTIPIGYPCDGEELLVLDADLHPLAAGNTGDLYIRGAGLSPGYWQDNEKTEAAFHPDPGRPGERIYRTGDLAWVGSDGLVRFVGRKDSQIKSRGYRIELGEIESALESLTCLDESAVVAIPTGGFEGWVICCAFVSVPSKDTQPSELRAALAKLVPGYMLPASWMDLDELPKNSNGKIDRPKLREMFTVDRDTRQGSRASAESSG